MRAVSLILVASFAVVSIAYAGPPADYYKDVNDKTGDALKSALHTIIDGHKPLDKYTDKKNESWFDREENVDVWEALAYTDSACPASKPDCGKIRLLYLDEIRDLAQSNRMQPSAYKPGCQDLWEREHVWPTSRGEFKNKIGNTDLHHIRPADKDVNNKHRNYGYDNVPMEDGTKVYDKSEDCPERSATEALLSKDSESFEPPDRAKGQVARMIFYMAVRYESPDDPEKDMPDLEIRNENGLTKEPWIGDLCTLLSWHDRFGPTDFERSRNDRVYDLQKNRNPFIDEPGWANKIWGHRCS